MAVVVIFLFLAVQLAVPISRLGLHDLAPRFGWQMFSSAVPVPQFEVMTTDTVVQVSLDDYMAHVRADVDILTFMPPHLCAVVPDAVLVTWSGGERRC